MVHQIQKHQLKRWILLLCLTASISCIQSDTVVDSLSGGSQYSIGKSTVELADVENSVLEAIEYKRVDEKCMAAMEAEMKAMRHRLITMRDEFTYNDTIDSWIESLAVGEGLQCVKEKYGVDSDEFLTNSQLYRALISTIMKYGGGVHQQTPEHINRAQSPRSIVTRRLQAGQPSDLGPKGTTYQITLWVTLVLTGCLLLGIYFTMQASQVKDPLLYSKLTGIGKR